MKIRLLLFTAFISSICFSQGTQNTDSTKRTDSAKIGRDSILRISNLSSQRDSAKINDIISVKIQSPRPISDFNTLYINGIKVENLKPWKEKACDATVFFRLNEDVQNLVASFSQNRSAEESIIPIMLSIGSADQCLAKSADPVFLEIKQKVNTNLAWIIALILLVIAVIAIKKNVLKDDNNLYYSLTRAQLFYWTLVFVFSYLYLCFETGLLPDIPTSVLTILGISIGTTALGKVVENTKKEDVPIDPNAKSEGFLLDILSDGTSINIQRFQNVVFNLVFGIIFIQKTISTCTLPDFDDTVLLLLGISSAAFAGLKVTEPTKEQKEPLPPAKSDPTVADDKAKDTA